MYSCKECSKEFRTNWELKRHNGNKRPCSVNFPKATNISTNLSYNSSNDTHDSSNDTHDSSNGKHESTTSLQCKYCLRILANQNAFRVHSKRCTYKDDAIRSMEIQLNKFVEPWSSRKCRFCDYESTRAYCVRRHVKNCKARARHRALLESEIETNERNNTTTIINNDNRVINNNINITVNPIGKENYSYITSSRLKSLSKRFPTDVEFLAKTLTYIHANPKHPENHNIVITNHRSNLALVKWKDEFIYRPIEAVIQKVTTNMLDKVCLEDDYDDLPKLIKQKYESVTENDEIDSKAASLFKLDLYSKLKSGEIQRITE